MNRDERPQHPNGPLAACYLAAAAGALLIVLGQILGAPWAPGGGGLLALALPGTGLAFYGTLAAIAVCLPGSRLLVLAPGFYLFVHTSLVGEMVLQDRLCPACLGVACAATAAAFCQWRRSPAEWPSLAGALVLGTVAAFFGPFDRVDEYLTRTLWPARLLDAVPAWVDRADIAPCDDRRPLRLLIFEKDCRS